MFRAKRFGSGSSGVVRRGGTGYAPGKVFKKIETYGNDWAQLRLRVLERDGYSCRRCDTNLRGVFYREVHHIKPLSRGGATVMSNLISLCSSCHHNQH
jgi:5-methylcytosine-specific restriction endonuclease McrA